MKGVVVTKKLYKGDNVICNFFPTNESSESWFAANYYDWSFFASDPRLCLPILSDHIHSNSCFFGSFREDRIIYFSLDVDGRQETVVAY